MFDDTPRGLLEALLIGGGLLATLTFAPSAIAVLAGIGYAMKGASRAEANRRKQKLSSSLQYLKRKNYVRVASTTRGVSIELTDKGRKRAAWMQKKRPLLQPIARPREWDAKWRVILFDISAEERAKRNAFRGFIRRLGAVMLQKSVWIYPFDCAEQVRLLREFFGLTDAELRVIVARDIGDDSSFRKIFKI